MNCGVFQLPEINSAMGSSQHLLCRVRSFIKTLVRSPLLGCYEVQLLKMLSDWPIKSNQMFAPVVITPSCVHRDEWKQQTKTKNDWKRGTRLGTMTTGVESGRGMNIWGPAHLEYKSTPKISLKRAGRRGSGNLSTATTNNENTEEVSIDE